MYDLFKHLQCYVSEMFCGFMLKWRKAAMNNQRVFVDAI